ncbi:MAG: hypothetical protein IIU99_07200 [Treponema sp.]|nr:hypothetical protein [Treponema sp.]
MKKKIGVVLFSLLLVFLLSSCDEVLSVVTVGENGEKIVNNYVSVISDKFYDETVTLKFWQDIDFIKDEEFIEIDDLLFKIENKKENIVVFGDEESAIEISFFDGGYKYTVFSSIESLNRMFE